MNLGKIAILRVPVYDHSNVQIQQNLCHSTLLAESRRMRVITLQTNAPGARSRLGRNGKIGVVSTDKKKLPEIKSPANQTKLLKNDFDAKTTFNQRETHFFKL